MVTQQSLVCDLSGVPLRISDEYVWKFGRGTVPDGMAREEETGAGFLISMGEWTQQDDNNGDFQKYGEFTTSNKVTLQSLEDAMRFNNYHEGLHPGVIRFIKKTILSANPKT